MIIELLNSSHARNAFNCGSLELNRYLQEQAWQHAKKDITRTYVAVEENSAEVVGYYSLCAGSISFEIVPENLPHHPIPIVLLARLAIAEHAQGRGLGRLLLLDSLTTAISIANQVGVYALAVDALNQAAFDFYLKYGFKSLSDDHLHLYLPIKTIRKLIA